MAFRRSLVSIGCSVEERYFPSFIRARSGRHELRHLPTLFCRSLTSAKRSVFFAKKKKKSLLPSNDNAVTNRSLRLFSASSSPDHHLHNDNDNPVVLNFQSAEVAYGQRSTKELLRAAISFRLCQVQFLVRHSERLLQWSRRVLGDTLTDALLQATLYGHFCAGEDQARIQPKIRQMEQAGIGSILDYVAEGNGDDDGSGSSSMEKLTETVQRENSPFARMYEYTDEASCDRHRDTFRACIRDVADLQADGYAAVKVSGLVNPTLLARMSRAILETQNLFAKFDTNGDGLISRDEFEQGYKIFFQDDTFCMEEMLESMQIEKYGGQIDYVSWSMLLRPQDLPKIVAGCRSIGPLSYATPSEEELKMMERLYERMHSLGREAAKYGTRLLVDAEQALFQPAIDNVVLDLQRDYNDPSKTSHPIVYNTYQCYLKDSGERLRTDILRATRLNFHFGAKLVRGAYMEGERALAAKLDYRSPIHNTKKDTDASYDDNVRFVLEESKKSANRRIELMLASHNQDSILKAISLMEKLHIDRNDPTVCFAQLYGMMDNLTYGLGKQGYRVFKYVPYGEVKLAMPYLIRRAKENSSITSGAARELQMIKSELKRRFFRAS